jgi:hypothetical protein
VLAPALHALAGHCPDIAPDLRPACAQHLAGPCCDEN